MTGADLNLRHLRLLLAASTTGSVTRAAQQCNVTQPAATQALQGLEAHFGAPLLERSPHGTSITPLGNILARRVERALDLLDGAAETGSGSHLTASTARLRALIEVARTESLTLAARNLGVTQPTVHRAIAVIEQDAGRALFKRHRRGLSPTELGRGVAHAAEHAFAELEQARYEMAEAIGCEKTSIIIGGMPLSRSYLLPDAIAAFHNRFPAAGFTIIEGPYETLLSGLRKAEIDFLIGALRDPAPLDDVIEEHLFDDELVIVAGEEHPLVNTTLTLKATFAFPWVVALPGAPARSHFDAIVASAEGRGPVSLVETSSMILLRELLSKGPYLAAVSRLQAESEMRRGLLTALPLSIPSTRRAIGITRRSNWKPTPMQAAFLAMLRQNVHFGEIGAA